MKTQLILLVMVLSGCQPVTQMTPKEKRDIREALGATVTRLEYPQDEVVCYVSDGYKSGGISCVRINNEKP